MIEGGYCRDCKWWLPVEEWGVCDMAGTTNGTRDEPSSLAWASEYYGYQASLATMPDFGCVQFEAKE